MGWSTFDLEPGDIDDNNSHPIHGPRPLRVQPSIFWTMYRFHPTFLMHPALFAVWFFNGVFNGKLASCMSDLIWKPVICDIVMPPFMSYRFTQKKFKDFSPNAILKKPTRKIKQPKNLPKSLHLVYYISAYRKKNKNSSTTYQYLIHNPITK